MSEWKQVRLGDHSESFAGGTPNRDGSRYFGGSIPWVKSTEVNLGRIRKTEEFLTEEGLRSSSARWITKNTVLIAMYGATAAQVAYLEIDATANQAVLAVVPEKGIDSLFLFYALSAAKQRLLFQAQGSGQPNLNKQIIDRLKIDLPSETTQRRIAEILTTVDEEMEQTEALVGKLEQMKAGLMHDLFTRGVTPDGHLRPTRQEAPHLYHPTPLGWLPNEWEVKPLGHLSEIVSGVTLGSKLTITGGVKVPYLRVANVQDGYFDLSEVKRIAVSPTQLEKLALKSGDVLMNEGGDFDKLGRGSVWQEEITPCIHQNHVFRVRPKTGMLRSYFLAFWSQSAFGKRYFVLNSKQSTNLASINSTQLHKFPVALPTEDEQEQIEARIAALQGKIDSETSHLAKLRQQKQGLMQDLLTGRVSVD
jgi:type I restriction enzyme S subunit